MLSHCENTFPRDAAGFTLSNLEKLWPGCIGTLTMKKPSS